MEENRNKTNNIEGKCTCYNCGHTYNERDIKKYRIHERDYTSQFAWIDAEIPLCKECQKDINEDWFSEKAIHVEYGMFDQYIYPEEEELFDYICSFQLEYQEKIFNQGFGGDKLTREEWIEQQRKILKSLYSNNNDKNIKNGDKLKSCDFCKDLLDCNEIDEIPWYEEGIFHIYDNGFYLIPRQDGRQEDYLRPHIEIEYCPKCSRKLKI